MKHFYEAFIFLNLMLNCFTLIALKEPETCQSGSVECKYIDGYDKPQWTTCVSNSYVEESTGNKYSCGEDYDEYCLYPCMHEFYQLESGRVYNDCLCDNKSLIVDNGPNEECQNPNLFSCNWYKECFNAKYSCKNVSNYVTYMKILCEIDNDQGQLLSKNGQRWLDASTTCLQSTLIPFIRPWQSSKCENVESVNYINHEFCYFREDDLTLCSLTCLDWLKIFWLVKGLLLNNMELIEARKILEMFRQSQLQCGSDFLVCRKDNTIIPFILEYSIKSQNNVAVNINEEQFKYIEQQFTSNFNIDRNNIDYYMFYNLTNNKTKFHVTIWITDKASLFGQNDSTSMLHEIRSKIIDKYDKGLFKPIIKINNANYDQIKLIVCEDISCANTHEMVILTEFKHEYAAIGVFIFSIIIIIIAIIIVYEGKLKKFCKKKKEKPIFKSVNKANYEQIDTEKEEV